MAVPIQDVDLRFKFRLKDVTIHIIQSQITSHSLALVFSTDIERPTVQHGSSLLPTMIDSPLFRVGRILHDIPNLSIVTLIKTCIIALSIVLFRGVSKWLLSIFLMPFSDPLRHLPGPPGSFFQNHFREVLE